MTEPTDAELKAMWQIHAADIGGIFDYARAVLAKWGTPAPVEPVARPMFWKGQRVNYTNDHHVSFTAKVKKVETRWSEDRKPYHYAHILIDGEKASTIVPQSYLSAIDAARKQGGA